MNLRLWRPSAHTVVSAGRSLDVLLAVGQNKSLLNLGAPERARWCNLRLPQDREDFVAARTLARHLIGSLSNDGFYKGRLSQSCRQCGGPHGQPVIIDQPQLSVSWAHSQGRVAAAVSTSLVGIDIELVAATPPPLPPSQRPETESLDHRWVRWTRTEALVKFGIANLDSALSWRLDWPVGGTGQLLYLPSWVQRTPVTVTDFVAVDETWVASVAARGSARFSAVPMSYRE